MKRSAALAVALCLIFGGCVSKLTSAIRTRPLLAQSADQERADRATCVDRAAEKRDEVSLRYEFLACMLAKGYAVHEKMITELGMVSVEVSPPPARTEDDARRDVAFCEESTVGHPKTPLRFYNPAEFAAMAPAPDGLIERYKDCFNQRGYTTREK